MSSSTITTTATITTTTTTATPTTSQISSTRYRVISHQWANGFTVKECPPEEDPESFFNAQSKWYSSVMFISKDDGKAWQVYKKKGVGAIGKIMKNKEEYLSKKLGDVRMQSTLSVTPSLETFNRTIDEYSLGTILGEGTYAEVRHAKAKDGSEAAIKFLFDQSDVESIQNEIECMKLASHENCVQLLGSEIEVILEGQVVSYLILELAPNMELFQLVILTGAFDEDIARFYAKQLYSVIGYFHERGVTHRDLKPENILLDSNYNLKIADFGLACKLPPQGKKLNELAGSPGYISPEVYSGSYHHENDIWAAAVIHFILMTGCPPFRSAEDSCWWYSKLKNKSWSRWWTAHSENSGLDLTPDAKDFFQTTFIIDPASRPSIKEILTHKWFSGKTCLAESLESRFKAKMSPKQEYYEYQETEYQEDFMSGQTNRGEPKANPEVNPEDDPPPLSSFVLPRSRPDNFQENMDPIPNPVKTRGEKTDQNEEKEDAEVYSLTVNSFTKFESISPSNDLYEALKSVCTANKIKYLSIEKSGKLLPVVHKYKLKCTVHSKLIFTAQVFQVQDSPKRIVELKRILGSSRDYMCYYAKFCHGMSDFILTN